MKDLSTLTYDEIRALPEVEAARSAIESMDIKGYNVYFIDFKGYRGYSYLVYKNNHVIIDDYANLRAHILKEKGLEGLRRYYIDSINNKLFTEEELAAPLKSYDEYRAKSDFLNNYYAKEVDYISIFFIGTDEEREKHRKMTEGMLYDKVFFCYMDKKYASFIEHHVELSENLDKLREALKDDFEYQKSAFIYEMYNHEYQITFSDENVLTAFGLPFRGHYNSLTECFDKLKFTQVQRDAYMAARKEVLSNKEVA